MRQVRMFTRALRLRYAEVMFGFGRGRRMSGQGGGGGRRGIHFLRSEQFPSCTRIVQQLCFCAWHRRAGDGSCIQFCFIVAAHPVCIGMRGGLVVFDGS